MPHLDLNYYYSHSDVAAPRSLSRLSWVSRPTRPRARAGCTGEAALGAVRSSGGPVRVKYLPTYLPPIVTRHEDALRTGRLLVDEAQDGGHSLPTGPGGLAHLQH